MSLDLQKTVFEAGVAGEGGAGFPTHVKLAKPVNYVVLNGAECEPLLRTDRYVMREHAEAIVRAAREVSSYLKASRCILGLKGSYLDEITALEAARTLWYPELEILHLESFYPVGDEHALVYEAIGTAIPPGGIPLDIGCVVLNVATMLAIFDATEGRPFTDKYITVTGAVQTPTVMRVPIGTLISECIKEAGGVTVENYSVVLGGPMMGRTCTAADVESEVVTKTSSGIIVIPSNAFLATYGQTDLRHVANRAKAACIQCRMCTDLCPRYLLGHPLEPHKIMRIFAMCSSPEDVLSQETIQNAELCCECGICELIACPMRIHPRMVNVLFKQKLRAAGIKNEPESIPVSAERDYRKIPTFKSASATGVVAWYDFNLVDCHSYVPNEVKLPLHQSIGAASIPTVHVGDIVRRGDKVAHCPDNALGTMLHASITGKVTQIDDRIWIKQEVNA